MSGNFYYSFPAVKGRQAKRDFFVIMCPLNIISKLFIFNEHDELPPEYRAQRILNKNRIPDITEYIIANPNEYVFSSLTASIDGEFEFAQLATNQDFKDIGVLKISMDSRLLINDGQHRKYAIEDALKANPELSEETISVVLFIDEGLKRSQQIFSDLNKHAVNVSRSIGILYDSRDDLAMVTKNLLDSNTKLKKFTDLENSTLPKFSNKLFTLSNLYSANKRIIGKNSLSEPTLVNFIIDFWNFLTDELYEWNLVFNKETSPYNLRNDSIISYGVVLEALGMVGNDLYETQVDHWKDYLKNINKIDWDRSNLEDWSKRVISSSGRISKNSNCIKLTANLIKIKLGLPLTKEEEKIENKFLKER
ncbi:DNA sulfur modification protein DndB [Anaerovirgula multivorans]|uniref:DNA sulfur modification protein DndB n=1 Tax=Anaerovirgula multivorans TaxID=312168 RepID=A0A239CKC6_9FIRM|nr:DNA sulfur modification protein DndB [Anaerovirgula multivorans]SNS20362.1 DNA sulfur modification protein DndB [Anaerovirgula multivorans]